MTRTAGINTGKMVRLAVLVAIILLMAYTPLGYLRAGPVEITFIMIPVAIAAIVVGPFGGAIAGGVFGITSFLMCFGSSPFGAALLGINPFFTFVLCIIPRILAGYIPGLIYAAGTAVKKAKRKTIFTVLASLAAPLLNTVLFVGGLFVLFGSTDFVRGFGETTWSIIVLLVGVNGLIEAGVGFIVIASVSRALIHFIPVKNEEKALRHR